MSHSAREEQLTHPGECVSPVGERTIYSINTPRLLKDLQLSIPFTVGVTFTYPALSFFSFLFFKEIYILVFPIALVSVLLFFVYPDFLPLR